MYTIWPPNELPLSALIGPHHNRHFQVAAHVDSNWTWWKSNFGEVTIAELTPKAPERFVWVQVEMIEVSRTF